MVVLVTGGAGYIGSHTCVELLQEGHEVIIYDNLYNSKLEVIRRIEKITNKKVRFYENDCLDTEALRLVFQENKIDAVIHFAGFKAVGESVQKPIEYYQNNIGSTLNILKIMREFKCFNIVFSSSACVYGNSKAVPFKEEEPTSVTNPYGRTKVISEEILTDLAKADSRFNIAILRYFNPIGAHESGLIGEDPNGIPNNLVPYITQVAVGKLMTLGVFGNDYNTIDGTGVRDYIHVVDLAQGHLCALKKLLTEPGLVIYNLGTGKGSSVLQVVKAFEKATGRPIPYLIKPRRVGDIDASYACCDKAEREIGFKAKYDINKMAQDSWNWQKKNPNGYE